MGKEQAAQKGQEYLQNQGGRWAGRVYIPAEKNKNNPSQQTTTRFEDTSEYKSTQNAMADSKASFDKAMADLKAQEDADKKAADEKLRQNAIAAESAKARNLASANQAEIATQLQQSLAKPKIGRAHV